MPYFFSHLNAFAALVNRMASSIVMPECRFPCRSKRLKRCPGHWFSSRVLIGRIQTSKPFFSPSVIWPKRMRWGSEVRRFCFLSSNSAPRILSIGKCSRNKASSPMRLCICRRAFVDRHSVSAGSAISIDWHCSCHVVS